MDLHSALEAATAWPNPARVATIVAAVLVVAGFAVAVSVGTGWFGRRRGDADAAGLIATWTGVVLIAAVALINNYVDSHTDAAREEAVARYLLVEHDLVALEPVTVSGASATAQVVTPSGDRAQAEVQWARVHPAVRDSSPPDGYDPVTVTLTPKSPTHRDDG